MDRDNEYMQKALALAQKAKGRTSPNPMVGCVIVRDGKVIGSGYHQKAGTPHAEVQALRVAGEAARDSTLYVNLEPCSHYGRTPPCTKAIIAAGVKRAVVAMTDPNPLVAGRGIRELAGAGIQVDVGTCQDEAKKLNEVFIKYISSGMPFVVLKTAMTLDGKIATCSGESRYITGEAARHFVHQLRDTYTGIMVSVKTVKTDDPLLTTRLSNGEEGRNPVRIIVDTKGTIPLTAKVLRQMDQVSTYIAVSKDAPEKKLTDIQKLGGKILFCDSSPLGIDLLDLVKKLGCEQIDSILLEGGGTLNYYALQAGIVDKILCFIAPKVVGGDTAPTWARGEGIKSLEQAFRLDDIEVKTLGEDVLISGYVQRGRKTCSQE